MRKIVYDCYFKNAKMKTVATLSEANAWKMQNAKNSVKERLTAWTDQKPETEEQIKKREERRAKKIKAINNKRERKK